MGSEYTRNDAANNIADGNVISAADLDGEFDKLVTAFAAGTGHSHDGTAGEGGYVTKLLGTSLTIGDGTAGTDIAVTFDGETNDGVLTWMEDEDRFDFADKVKIVESTDVDVADTSVGALVINGGTVVSKDLLVGDDIFLDSDASAIKFGDDQDITLTHAADASLALAGAGGTTGLIINNTASDGDPFLAFALSGTQTFTMGIDDGDSDKFKIGTSAIGTSTILTLTGDDVILADDLSLQSDGALLNFGADDDITLTHTADTSLALGGAGGTTGLIINNTATDGDPFLAFALSGTQTFTMGIDDGDSDKFKIGTSAIGTSTIFTIAGDDIILADDLSLQSDGALLNFGADDDITLTHAADTSLALGGAGSTTGLIINNTAGDGDPFLAFALSGTQTFTMGIDDGDGDAFKIGTSAMGTDTRLSIGSGGDFTVNTDTATFTSANSTDPLLIIKNTTSDTSAGRLHFVKDKGTAGADGDDIGTIEFISDDDAQNQTSFAKIVAGVSESAHTDESGKLTFYVAESDGTNTALTAGLVLEGEHATDGEVDVTIGAGATSTTSVVGVLDVVSDITGSTLNADGDTSAGDNAAIGYTAGEGLILTGQGSTNDVTVKNDADADVLVIPTGTTNVDIVGVATASTFEPDGDTSAGDNAAIGYTAGEGLILTGQGSTNDVTIKNDADADVLSIATGTTILTINDDVKVVGRAYGTATTNTNGQMDLEISNNWNYTPGGTDEIELDNFKQGQSGTIFLDNSGGHTLSVDSTILINATTLTAIGAAGKYMLTYFCTVDQPNATLSHSDNDNKIIMSASGAMT